MFLNSLFVGMCMCVVLLSYVFSLSISCPSPTHHLFLLFCDWVSDDPARPQTYQDIFAGTVVVFHDIYRGVGLSVAPLPYHLT